MMENCYLTGVYAFESFGPQRTKLLLSYFKRAKNIWSASASDLLETGLRQTTVEKFIEFRKSFDIEEYFSRLSKLGIKVITVIDEDYPGNLKGLEDAPQVLYVRGEIKKSDTQAVAIVGTRMMTSYGKEVANKFASELASYGITIVSGLALGVDAEAQRSALSVGGRTIGVLASGLDIITPVANRYLALKFIKGNGALVSEKPLGFNPFAAAFPVRDRLISGLAKAVIVVEGRMKSGTFYTVKAALAQGRPVFSVPGPITSAASEGTNYLIQNGAKLTTKVKDVLDELDMQLKVDVEAMDALLPASEDEEKFLEILGREPLHLDEVVRISGRKTSEVSARLTIMEMKGMIKNVGNGIYRKI